MFLVIIEAQERIKEIIGRQVLVLKDILTKKYLPSDIFFIGLFEVIFEIFYPPKVYGRRKPVQI